MSNRPVVIVDLDNVVYDWSGRMAVELDRLAGVQVKPQDYKTWSIWEDWGVPKGLFDWVWEESIREGTMYAKGRPIPGSVEALWAISDMEYHIHIVTSRLNKFRLHDQAVMNTVEWLKEFRIPYRSLSFTHDKHQIDAFAIIDDNPLNVVGHPAQAKFIFPAPHNKEWKADNMTVEMFFPKEWAGIVTTLRYLR